MLLAQGPSVIAAGAGLRADLGLIDRACRALCQPDLNLDLDPKSNLRIKPEGDVRRASTP
jgi:hypothetical protein